ncbi:ribosomal protein L7/L12 [Pseudomonas sp. MWU13-2625]|nr:ribosomal protein L7/L12 [Pseudomonas sp. MWU13-2625]
MTKDEFIDWLPSLTVLEAQDIMIMLKKRLGTSETSGEASSSGEFIVILDAVDESKKVPVIKAVRGQTGLGLKEAKNLVDSAPNTVQQNLSKAEKDAIKIRLEEAGATVKIRCPSCIQSVR